MIGIKLIDGKGSNSTAKVDPNGVVAVGPLKSSIPVFKQINIVDTAFNFFEAVGGMRFLITSVVINATRSTSVNGSLVEIYEANSATSTVVVKDLLTIDIARSATVPILPLQLDVAPGAFINGKAGSVDVNVTIAGYFLEDNTGGVLV